MCAVRYLFYSDKKKYIRNKYDSKEILTNADLQNTFSFSTIHPEKIMVIYLYKYHRKRSSFMPTTTIGADKFGCQCVIYAERQRLIRVQVEKRNKTERDQQIYAKGQHTHVAPLRLDSRVQVCFVCVRKVRDGAFVHQ